MAGADRGSGRAEEHRGGLRKTGMGGEPTVKTKREGGGLVSEQISIYAKPEAGVKRVRTYIRSGSMHISIYAKAGAKRVHTYIFSCKGRREARQYIYLSMQRQARR